MLTLLVLGGKTLLVRDADRPSALYNFCSPCLLLGGKLACPYNCVQGRAMHATVLAT